MRYEEWGFRVVVGSSGGVFEVVIEEVNVWSCCESFNYYCLGMLCMSNFSRVVFSMCWCWIFLL